MKQAQTIWVQRAQRGSTGWSSGQRVAARAALVAGLAGGLLLAGAASASAEGTASVIADVQCDQAGNGVLDLTLINEGALDALFVVVGPQGSADHTVAPGAASAVTFNDLADGAVALSVTIDGVAADVAATVACDVATGEPPIVEVLSPSAQGEGGTDGALPRTGSSSGGLLLGSALVAAGVVASLASRRRYS